MVLRVFLHSVGRTPKKRGMMSTFIGKGKNLLFIKNSNRLSCVVDAHLCLDCLGMLRTGHGHTTVYAAHLLDMNCIIFNQSYNNFIMCCVIMVLVDRVFFEEHLWSLRVFIHTYCEPQPAH